LVVGHCGAIKGHVDSHVMFKEGHDQRSSRSCGRGGAFHPGAETIIFSVAEGPVVTVAVVDVAGAAESGSDGCPIEDSREDRC